MVSRFIKNTPDPQSTEFPSLPRQNPRFPTPNEDGGLHPARNPGGGLVECLGSIVDDLRQINTDFGLRPYRLFSVVTRWSGGQHGRGEESVVSEVEILPTPNVFMDRLSGVLKAGGRDEDGPMTVNEISPRYSEEDISAIFHQQPLPPGFTGFIEMREDTRDGELVTRRRFVVQGVPMRRADDFDWQVKLTIQEPARNVFGQLNRTGDPAT